MATTIQSVNISESASFFPSHINAHHDEFYRQSQNRVYALAFWMTDNELAAEELTRTTLQRAFEHTAMPSAASVDGALISELRQFVTLGTLTLDCTPTPQVMNVRKNVLRANLERAVVQLPHTERLIYLMHDGEGYTHSRIARTLGISEAQCQRGLHQARICLRELLASMS